MNDFLLLVTGAVVAGALMALALLTVAVRKRRASSGHSNRAAEREDVLAPSGLEWAILERMSEGLVVLNEMLRPVAANQAARKLLGFPEGPLPPRLPSDEVRTVARLAQDRSQTAEEIVSIWFPAPDIASASRTSRLSQRGDRGYRGRHRRTQDPKDAA